MNRLGIFLSGIALASGLASCGVRDKLGDGTGRPNILFIMTDDHSYQTLSAYNKKAQPTPNLDRIAQEGAIFENSFVTNSICAPSRATMLTGKFSHINGQTNNAATFDGNQLTFPKLLQDAGYETSLIGKWHLKSEPTGFNHWDILIGQGTYYNPNFTTNGVLTHHEGYITNIITEKALAWLGERDKTKPFCLLLHHKATHRDWQPDTALLNLYNDIEFELPENFFDTYQGRQAAGEQQLSIATDLDLVYDLKLLDKEGEIQTKYRKEFQRMIDRFTPEQRRRWDEEYDPIIADFKKQGLEGDELSKWKFQRYMHDYVRCVASVDLNIGRILKYLDDNELAKNTIVVYTSDQGFYMGEHGFFDKRFMYEQSLRTPLLVRYPQKIKAGTKVGQLVQNIDYAPTFLDYAGVKIPAEIQGISLKPLLEDKQTEWREAIYYHYYDYPAEHMVKRHYGIRTERYKLIHFYNDIDQWELYDLENDPDEMNNIYDQRENSELIDSLKMKLAELQVQYEDADRSTY
ncbi:sulfatase [Mangrovibacterium sp.]|uniref:sulfatase family protein n=1 Tax=Mangrovibacterium sp. TaxID=1961364 RepID=UPI003564D0E8